MKLVRIVAALVAAALLAAACGSSSETGSTPLTGDPAPTETTAPATEAPATTAAMEEEAMEEETMEDDGEMRIVSLSPTATEMLFAIGAGDLVVAADAFSNYPADAPTTDLSGFDPNAEATLAFEPTMIVSAGTPPEFAEAMTAAGVEMVDLFAAVTLDDTYAQIEQLGAKTGHIAEAAELVGQMQTDVAALTEQASGTGTYYHELDDTLFSVTSSTFIGEVYSLAGLTNAADPADPDGESFGYPQLSAEFLVDADPDLIFLADTKCCGQTAETVSARPGWDALTAVQEGRIFELDDDIASRWGPRVVDFLRVIVEATATIPA